MNIGFTPAERAFRAGVIDFLEREITPDFTEELEKEDAASSYSSPEFSRKPTLARLNRVQKTPPSFGKGAKTPFLVRT